MYQLPLYLIFLSTLVFSMIKKNNLDILIVAKLNVYIKCLS